MENKIMYYETIHQKEEKCSEMVGHNTMKFKYEENKGEK
jgi:hypothetical protein